MRITDIVVDGFGVWSALELSELSEQLSVFYGPNEAGKTTLMQFVRSVLYGFSPERRARYLPPLRAGRGGGAIRATIGPATYTISRHADESGEASEAPLVNDGRELNHDEAALAALLGHVDEPVFNNVFACGLREIQELGTLSDTQAAGELYDLTLGVDRVSLADVLSELQVSRNRLLAVDDRPSLVTQLLGQRQRLQAEIDEFGRSTATYLSLSSERQTLEAEITRAEADSQRLESQAHELAVARALGERWRRRAVIDRQLTSLGGYGSLPADALARFDRLEKRLAVRRRRMRRLARQRGKLLAEIGRLDINEPLCRQALRLEALGEQQEWIDSLASQVDELENEILQLQAQREESVKQWGLDVHSTSTGAEPLSKKSVSELRAAARNLRQAKRDRKAFRQQRSAAEDMAEGHRKQLESTLGDVKDKGLTHALAEAGERVSQLRKRVQLDERLDQMSRRQRELGEESHDHLEHQVLPGWAIAALGCLFALGCALVMLFVAGMVLPANLSESLDWTVGLVGVGAAAAAVAMKIGMERLAAYRLDACHDQSHGLERQIEQAKKERDELDAQLPRGGGPLVARLQTAEKELARLEELMPLDTQRETATRHVDAARQQEQQAHGAYRQHRGRWQALVRHHGLPATLAPHRFGEYSRRRGQLRDLDRAIADQQQQLDRRRAEYNLLARRITQVVAEVGIGPQTGRPADQLRQCLAELKDQQSRIARREELARHRSALRARGVKLRRSTAQLRRRRRQLLTAAGTREPAEFRRRALLQAESGRLEAERVQLAHEIAASIAGHLTDERLAELLASEQGLEQLDTQLADARHKTAEQLNLMREKRGEMGQQLKTLLEDRQLPHKRIELDIVEKRLHDALDRWRVLAVCGMMLESVRQHYELEHQPLALREASGYLKRLTGGRYTRVWTPLGERVLRVDDGRGHSIEVERLSRGTREQLFVALRLALISSYARRGVNLPLVLDDVLVNFDLGRAKAAALVLRDFARQGNQVLIFTCHEHIAKLFKHLKADVRQLPDNALADAAGTAVRRSRRPRPEVPVESEPEPVFEELEPSPAPPIAEPVAQPAAPPMAEPVAEIEPPPAPTIEPAVTPPIRQTPRHEPRVQRVDWSAEEFEGELADRVRRPANWPDDSSGSTGSGPTDEAGDAEAA